MSTNQVFLHVGMHKTATTSIQRYLFGEYDKTHITYLGIRHPSVGGGSYLDDRFMYRFINLVTKASDHDFERGIVVLDKRLDALGAESQLPLVLSDENLYCTSSISGQMPLDERVRRVGRIFRNMDLKVIATVRPQPKLLFSLYVQMYPFLGSPKPTFEDFWSSSNVLAAYHYDQLYERFSSLECCSEILFIDFDKLNYGESDRLCEFIGLPHCDLGRMNARSEDANVKFTKISLADYLLRKTLGLAIHIKRYPVAYALSKTAYKFLQRFNLTSTSISKPDAEMLREISYHFLESNLEFRKISGIDYVGH